ncbi:MAG: glutathione S-transferase family protein [Pseudomonadota bacterium]
MGVQFDKDYMKLNPNGVVPTLEDNGNVVIESTLINEYLDDAYPDASLKPDAAGARHTMRLFGKKIDDALHPACGILTYAIGVRPGLLKRPKEEVDALVNQIPHAGRRAVRRSVVDNGVRAPEFRDAMAAYLGLFDTANAMLEGNDWLAGANFSLADCAFMPYVIRLDHLNQRAEIEKRPNVARWYEAIQQRPAFEGAVAKWIPAPLVANFNKAGDAVADDIAEVMA